MSVWGVALTLRLTGNYIIPTLLTWISHYMMLLLKKICEYRAADNNRPSNSISFMPAVATTSGRLHCELVRILFLQAHRETDRFFAASGVEHAQHNQDQFRFRRAAFYS
jgi:hypothetical protein